MGNSTIASPNQFEQDQEIWLSLKQAIARSSGFQRWLTEQSLETQESLDLQVRRYLKETLATLAY
jgi:hypothetical protein